MTTYTKATLATFFETGDVPGGTDYANLIDSQVNIAETSTQAMQGSLSMTELVAARVSAANGSFTGLLSAENFATTILTASALAAVSLTLTGDLNGTDASFTLKVSAASLNVTGDVSAAAGTVYGSAMRSTNGLFAGVGIVSAAGTTQGAGALLTNVINRGQGVSDGVTTGFAIPANRTGLTQYLLVETNTSANLWPPSGGTINGKAANTVFALAGQTSYTIFHVGASAYGVK